MEAVVRMATVSDMENLVKARFDYFDYEKWVFTSDSRDAIETSFRQYLTAHLNKDLFIAMIELENQIASVAFLSIAEKLANPSCPTGKIGTLLNLLTYPKHRNKGYATCTLRALIDIAREQNLSYIELSASEIGLSLYKKLGFQELDPSHFIDMKLSLL